MIFGAFSVNDKNTVNSTVLNVVCTAVLMAAPMNRDVRSVSRQGNEKLAE